MYLSISCAVSVHGERYTQHTTPDIPANIARPCRTFAGNSRYRLAHRISRGSPVDPSDDLYRTRGRDLQTESVREFPRSFRYRDSNPYFFPLPFSLTLSLSLSLSLSLFPLPGSVNLIRVLWTSSRSRRILTGRERDADAENWTTVKPRPASREREARPVAEKGGEVSRCCWTMCRG